MSDQTTSPKTPKVQGLSNIEIAQQAKLKRIDDVAQDRLGIPEDALHLYGRYKAKVSLDYIDGLKDQADGNTYGDKLAAYVRWEPVRLPFWVEYRVRHNGSDRANLDPNAPVPPVGETLPSFTVHALAGGATLFERGRFAHEIQLAVENLTDELYAEFSNATFFRPEPGRSINASYRLRF